MSKIGFIGTGEMGSRMALHLLNHKHELRVWNRTPEKLTSLIERGAQPAATPGLAAKNADFVISMVRDDDASRAVWLDHDDGALAGMAPGTVGIESSTLTVDWIKELASAFSERRIGLLDAPVAGSRPQADAGKLIYLVGGDEAVFEKAKPLLLSMGASAHYTGQSGSAAAVKLMINALFGIQLAAIGELIGFARRLGVDDERAIEVLTTTPVCSPAVKIASAAMLSGNFSPMFPIELVEKDFKYVVHTAASKKINVPMAQSAHKIFAKALTSGYGQDNITGVVKLY